MGVGPAQNYEGQMQGLLDEFKSLPFEQRKYRFTEFIRREADMFAGCIDAAHVTNVMPNDFQSMMEKRNYYLNQLYNNKDVCAIF